MEKIQFVQNFNRPRIVADGEPFAACCSQFDFPFSFRKNYETFYDEIRNFQIQFSSVISAPGSSIHQFIWSSISKNKIELKTC